jgi:type IV fimbrial biogenesis protein FimT
MMMSPTGNNKNADSQGDRSADFSPLHCPTCTSGFQRFNVSEIRKLKRTECRAPKGSRAFTLIELLIVMALLLIVLGVTFPSLKNFFKGRTLDSEARRFLSLTRYGQSRAVSEGVPMVLWVDVRERTYGLQVQAGYLANDTKAIEYDLDDDLQIEVSTPPATAFPLPNNNTAQVAGNLPAIRFTPDGFIGETSPETIQIREGQDRENAAIWISQNANRLNYEIRASQR